MENNIKVKKVIRNIYNIDYSKILLKCDNEFIVQANGISEFTKYLEKIDLDNGIIVTPLNYRYGLFYSTDNGGEIYASNIQVPDITTFSLKLIGLKKKYFYRITIIARDTGSNSYITDDRTITISDDTQQQVLAADLKGYTENQSCTGFFRSNSNEINLFFTLGKIVIKDIIIDEVLLEEEDNLNIDESEADVELPEGKEILAGYGTFDLAIESPKEYTGKYIQLVRSFGKGIILSYDSVDQEYVLERDNSELVIVDSFTNSNYIVDFNFSKVPNAGIYDHYEITDVNTDISPTSLKQGYICFALLDKSGKRVSYHGNGRLTILIKKIV